MKILGKS